MRKLLFSICVLLSSLTYAQSNNLELEPCLEPFYHGVASGDPLTDRVILWTRVTPTDFSSTISVSWKISATADMSTVVNSGIVQTNASKDFTVKVDATGLQAETYYYYEFSALGYKSPVGRTKTASAGRQSARFAVVSCANLEAGYFNVYKLINEKNDVDAVIMLGDYIYEYQTGGYSPNAAAGRVWEPNNEIITLEDYRSRYSSYRLDADLRRSHQFYPWICVWDDHESANDSWMDGAENHNTGEGNWSDRKRYSKQAYFEWLPIRQTNPNDTFQIYRTLSYGNLLDLFMLDTRLHGREEQKTFTDNSTARELLGADQRTWLHNAISQSPAQWKIIGQQVMLAPFIVLGVPLNQDQWDGYPAERNKLINHIRNNNINNVVVLTGDIHTSWGNDIPASGYNASTGANSAGVEFVTPSVTSPGMSINVGVSVIRLANPHMKHIQLTKHGYILLDVNPQRVQGDWYYMNTIDESSLGHAVGASYSVSNGQNRLVSVANPTVGDSTYGRAAIPAICPDYTLSVAEKQAENFVVLALYPNPADDFFTIHYHLNESGDMALSIYDMTGKLVKNYDSKKIAGVWTERYAITELTAGNYVVSVRINGKTITKKLVVQ